MVASEVIKYNKYRAGLIYKINLLVDNFHKMRDEVENFENDEIFSRIIEEFDFFAFIAELHGHSSADLRSFADDDYSVETFVDCVLGVAFEN